MQKYMRIGIPLVIISSFFGFAIWYSVMPVWLAWTTGIIGIGGLVFFKLKQDLYDTKHVSRDHICPHCGESVFSRKKKPVSP
jgi:hypothetical protein